jgi:L-asparaginase / beta-aspartyl-peptidase
MPLTWGADAGNWAVLLHGGAGAASAGEREDERRAGMLSAASAAAQVLRDGGSALDAVERAVILLEDAPGFNAGTGACLNEHGLIELDASIMEGTRLRGGGVCALPPYRNPIAIARAVLDEGRHVLYAGEGASRFAREHGFTPATSEAMTTPEARAQWQRLRAEEAAAGATREGAATAGGGTGTAGEGAATAGGGTGPGRGANGGTVGAVAIDTQGHVAAATSTGGIAGKRAGRVGDSPVLGAGTYADDEAGAASATGAGEAILRVGLAHQAIARMRGGASAEQAALAAVDLLAARVGGSGGIILVDKAGRLGWARNTASMIWAAAGQKIAAPAIVGA